MDSKPARHLRPHVMLGVPDGEVSRCQWEHHPPLLAWPQHHLLEPLQLIRWFIGTCWETEVELNYFCTSHRPCVGDGAGDQVMFDFQLGVAEGCV